jgi:hypothetical protein
MYHLTNIDTQLSKNSEPFFAAHPPHPWIRFRANGSHQVVVADLLILALLKVDGATIMLVIGVSSLIRKHLNSSVNQPSIGSAALAIMP